MEVCFLASGAELTVLAPDEFEGKTAKAVKQVLATKIPGFILPPENPRILGNR